MNNSFASLRVPHALRRLLAGDPGTPPGADGPVHAGLDVRELRVGELEEPRAGVDARRALRAGRVCT